MKELKCSTFSAQQIAAFWRAVNRTETCWEWTGKLTRGYGIFSATLVRGARQTEFFAHRVSYALAHGETPPSAPSGMRLVLDHMCENKRCVNPGHLRLVTQGINSRAGSRHNTNKTHCPQGHEYTPENTYFRSNRNQRDCRACRLANYHAAHPEAKRRNKKRVKTLRP